MADIGDLLAVLEKVDIKQLAKDTLTANAELIADMNATQLAQGRRATGTEIKPKYSALTIELKKGKSGLASITDRVTLYDTGSHYKNLYAEVKGDDLEQGSRDIKSEALQKKYGAIYGLTDDSQEELINQRLQGDFIGKFIDQTGLE